MKQILFLAAAALLCASCFHVNTNFKGTIGGKDTVKGEGPVVSRTFEDLKDFDAIQIIGQADVTFTQSPAYEVTLHTQENILDYLDYHVEGTTLVIQLKDRHTVRAEKYDLVIQAPDLRRIEVAGAADFEIPAGLRTEGDLTVEVNGAGDLNFAGIRCNNLKMTANGAADIKASSLDVQSLKVEVNGAGDVKLDGQAGDASLSVNGAGDIDARNLKVSGAVSKHASGLAKIKS